MSDSLRKVLHAASALADLGEEIAGTNDFEEMVSSSLHVVLGALAVRRGVVAEYHAEASRLRVVASRGLKKGFDPEGFTRADAEALRSSEAPLPSAAGAGHNAPRPDAAPANNRGAVWSRLLEESGLESVTPMLVRGELVGVILLGGKASDEPFAEEDQEIVRVLARHVGVGLHNHRLLREVARRAEENGRLFDELKGVYSDTVRAFAAAIDCKDRYTQGHSERVGKYSEAIARELGWPDERVEGIAVAGYLHDVGKLVVDRDIINAPYRIDAKKSSELNRHPAAGFEILSPIRHPHADIPLAARYHHERPDGRGYPEGLKGEEIPLGAKVVSLADSFDAMTTDRPYRRRRPFAEVVEDLRRNAGRQFDAAVVAAFCRALLKEVNGETRPRVILRLLGRDYIDAEQAAPLLSQLLAELGSGAHAAAASHV